MENVVSVTILGKGGHGSRPDEANNPILCFAEMQSFFADVFPKLEIRSVDAGTAGNVIPECLNFTCFVPEEISVEAVKNLAAECAKMFLCTADFE